MKPFTKRLALVTGLLFTAMLCLGIVYIDTVNNYWQFSGGFIRLVVNTNAQASITIDTNTLRLGINTNNVTSSVFILGRTPATNATGNGSSGSTVARINIQGGNGGSTFETTSANGASAGGVVILGGTGGSAPLAITNGGSGSGGAVSFTGGSGGTGSAVATNSSTGGSGGTVTLQGGAAGSATGSPTNGVGGAGGSVSLAGGTGGSGGSGWIRKGGDGGGFQLAAGQGASSVRTNGGNGGGVSLEAGPAGSTSTAGDGGKPGEMIIIAGAAAFATGGGNPQPGGLISLRAGAGSTGATNSNGGRIHLIGGAAGGAGALDGDILLGVATNGTIRGAVGVRVPNPQQSLDVQGSTQVSSNIIYTNLTVLAATNSTANTNITVNFDQAVTSLYLTNHASFTNVVNLVAGKSKSIIIFITAVGGPYNLVWPTLGGASFGTRLYTNANSPIWSSVTNKLAVSFTSDDTNAQISMTEWK